VSPRLAAGVGGDRGKAESGWARGRGPQGGEAAAESSGGGGNRGGNPGANRSRPG